MLKCFAGMITHRDLFSTKYLLLGEGSLPLASFLLVFIQGGISVSCPSFSQWLDAYPWRLGGVAGFYCSLLLLLWDD
eukprot:7286628-Ditylum_brightwellii.AAC.1